MKTAKLVIGIISMVLFVLVAFQSCAAGLGNALADNGEVSGTSGMLLAFCMLIADIVGVATRKSKGGGIVAGVYTLTGVCALPRALSPHRALLPCAEIGGLRRDRETYTFPATACAVYPFVYPTKANTLLCKLFTFMGFC